METHRATGERSRSYLFPNKVIVQILLAGGYAPFRRRRIAFFGTSKAIIQIGLSAYGNHTLIEHGDGLDFGTTISFLLHCCLYKIEYSTSELTKKTTALGLSGCIFLMVGL